MKNSTPIRSVIAMIRTRPPMYIHRYSISNLAMFINGYEAAMLDLCQENFDTTMELFNVWVGMHIRETGPIRWDGVLLDIAGSEEIALSLFWEKWDEFLADLDKGVQIELPRR